MTLPPVVRKELFQCAKLGGVALIDVQGWYAVGGEPPRQELLMRRVTECQHKCQCGVMRKDEETGSWEMNEAECLAYQTLNFGGEE